MAVILDWQRVAPPAVSHPGFPCFENPAIQQRQDEVLKELPDQDAGLQNAGLQTTGQTSSPVPSLSWDYRLGVLRAQQDQLLADQEAMMSRHTSTPMDERTFLKHPMQEVTGGVHTGGRGTRRWRHYAQRSLLELTWSLDTCCLSGWWSFRILDRGTLMVRGVNRWVQGTRSGTRVIHRPTCLQDYRLRMMVIQGIRPCHSPTGSPTWHRGRDSGGGGDS